MPRALTVMALSVTLLSACAGNSERTVETPSAKAVNVSVDPVLELQLPSGDVRIVQSEDDLLHASAVFFCAEGSERCARNAQEARIVHETDGQTSVLRFLPDSAYSTRFADVRVQIALPPVEALEVHMGAGALQLASPTACLSVKAGAGDVAIKAPFDDVASVALKAGVGEARLRTPDGGGEEQRPLLVGSKVNWSEGPGTCVLGASLTAGSIGVRLLP